jgi:hypothetical protein
MNFQVTAISAPSKVSPLLLSRMQWTLNSYLVGLIWLSGKRRASLLPFVRPLSYPPPLLPAFLPSRLCSLPWNCLLLPLSISFLLSHLWSLGGYGPIPISQPWHFYSKMREGQSVSASSSDRPPFLNLAGTSLSNWRSPRSRSCPAQCPVS